MSWGMCQSWGIDDAFWCSTHNEISPRRDHYVLTERPTVECTDGFRRTVTEFRVNFPIVLHGPNGGPATIVSPGALSAAHVEIQR